MAGSRAITASDRGSQWAPPLGGLGYYDGYYGDSYAYDYDDGYAPAPYYYDNGQYRLSARNLFPSAKTAAGILPITVDLT